jgi:DNA-binding MarR family transcriptional regulator
MSAEQPQPLSLFELLQLVRDGGMDLDFAAWAKRWLALGQFIAAGHGLRAALDRLDPTRHEFRPEAVDLLRLAAAPSATVGKVAEALAKWDVATANGVRTALAGLDAEIVAAAKPAPTGPKLKRGDLDILRALLATDPTARTVYDLEAAADLTRKTVSARLKRLTGQGLVVRPLGDRGGVALTPKGREVARRR